MINHTERAHSPIGASSSERWFNCPASVKLSEGIEQKTSEYAEEGTAAHEAGEYCLDNDKDAKDIIGMVFNGFEVTEEMAEAVQVYLDFIRMLIEGKEKSIELNIEKRFSLDYIDKELFGTNDCSIFDFDSGDIHVIDYKHGAGKLVQAENNSQLMYYALGVIKDVPYINNIYLTIVQPRRADSDGETIRTWKTDAKRLIEFEDQLKDRVEAVKIASNADNPYEHTKSGDHCTFCPKQPTCLQLKKDCMALAAQDFDVPVEEMVLPDPAELSDSQISQVLQSASMVSSWMDSVKSYALDKVKSGRTIEGYKLVEGRANRKWINESAVKEELDMLYGEDIYTPRKLKSPAQMEKLTGDKEFIARFTEKPSGAINLVPRSDKRKEVLPSAITDFNDN